MRRRRHLFLVAVVAILTIPLVPIFAGWSCNTYSNSEPSWVTGHGAVCAGSGSGCTECWDGGGTTCVDAQNGEVCKFYPANKN